MPNTYSTIVVGNLETTEKYFAYFEIECWDSTRTTLIQGPYIVPGVWDSTTAKWKMRGPCYFQGLSTGTTYSFRVRVACQSGGPMSDWSDWADEVAGDATAPSPTYAPSGYPTGAGLFLEANPSGAPTDLDHYDWTWNLTNTAPSAGAEVNDKRMKRESIFPPRHRT